MSNSTPQFAIRRVYIKDSSFEIPSAPKIFVKPFTPKAQIEFAISNNSFEEDLHEVSIKVTATVSTEYKSGDLQDLVSEIAYVAEVEQAGIFAVVGLNEQQLEHALGAFCPSILFPYLREALDNLIVKGSFPPLTLQPVDFESMYANRKPAAASSEENIAAMNG